MHLRTLGIGRWTAINLKNKLAPISTGNNKYSDWLKTKGTTSKPFNLECQKLQKIFRIIASNRIALLSCQ